MEFGMRNQHQIQKHNKTLIPASVNAIQHPPVLALQIGHFRILFTSKVTAHVSIHQNVGEIGSLITVTNALQKVKFAVTVVCR